MIKKLLGVIVIIVLGLFFTASEVNAQYVIENFESRIEIEKDTDLIVEERIQVEFTTPRHGIFRYIPLYHTASGVTIKTPVNVISIVDAKGNPYNYGVRDSSGNIEIKIGDADKFIEGGKTYIITYKISNVIRNFDDHYELYWNTLGSGWDTDIKKASAVIVSPYAGIEDSTCYSGRLGSDEMLCEIQRKEDELIVTAESNLGYSRDLTIVAALDKEGQLAYPSIIRRSYWFLDANWAYILVFVPLGLIFYVWNKRGRDKRYVSENVYYKPDNVATKTVSFFSRRNLPLVYHPIDGLTPAEVGTIIDEKVQTHDVVAEIVELARLGFLKIEKLDKKEYAFIRQKELSDENLEPLKDYQKKILKELFRKTNVTKSISKAEKLFEKKKELKDVRKRLIDGEYVLLSSFKNEFYTVLSEVKKDLYERMQLEGFFAENPEKVRIKWLFVYLGITVVVATLVFQFASITGNFVPIAPFVLLSSIGGMFSWFMPRRTPKGYSLYMQTLGLQDYLKKGKWRYENMEKNLFFEEILPLAISLQVIDQLADDMEKLGIKPPNYLGHATSKSFNFYFSDFYSSTASSLTSVPRSSSSSWSGGSGFSGGSGGGFGGGGGGSW